MSFNSSNPCNPCTPNRWKRLSDELPDAEVKEMLTSFWMVDSLVNSIPDFLQIDEFTMFIARVD